MGAIRFHPECCFIFGKLITEIEKKIISLRIVSHQMIDKWSCYPGVFKLISSRDIKMCTHGIFRLTTIGSRPSIIGSQNSSFLYDSNNIHIEYTHVIRLHVYVCLRIVLSDVIEVREK